MKKTAIIIVDHGSRVSTSNKTFEDFVSQFKEESPFDTVEAAHMELASPSLEDAFEKCAQQHAEHVIIVPYFFFRGRHIKEDIPRLSAQAAQSYKLSYQIADPLGQHPLMKQIISDQIAATQSKEH